MSLLHKYSTNSEFKLSLWNDAHLSKDYSYPLSFPKEYIWKPHWASTECPLGWQESKWQIIRSVDEAVEKRKRSCSADGNVNWCTHVQQFLRRLNTESPSDPEMSLLGIYRKEMKTHVHTKTCMRMFTATVFIIAKNRNNSNVPWLMNGQIICHISILNYWKYPK